MERRCLVMRYFILLCAMLCSSSVLADNGTETEMTNIVASASRSSGYGSCLKDGLQLAAGMILMTPDLPKATEADIQALVVQQEQHCVGLHEQFIADLRTQATNHGANGAFDASRFDTALHQVMVMTLRGWLQNCRAADKKIVCD